MASVSAKNRTYFKIVHLLFLYLWNDSEFRPQVVQSDRINLYSVDADFSTCSFNDAEQGQSHGGFTRSSPPHNTDLKVKQESLLVEGQPAVASMPVPFRGWGRGALGPVPSRVVLSCYTNFPQLSDQNGTVMYIA